MKFKQMYMQISAIILFCFPLLVSAQWLETTIYVPDSLCGIAGPQAFTYNETNNTIYVGGSHGNCVIAIDGTTDEKIAKISAGEDVQALCWNSINNKVYSANQWSDDVTVIDGASNAVITRTSAVNNTYLLS